jgi:hypothetical protein
VIRIDAAVRICANLMTSRHETFCAYRVCDIRRRTALAWRESRNRWQSSKAEADYALWSVTLAVSEACCGAAERVLAFDV